MQRNKIPWIAAMASFLLLGGCGSREQEVYVDLSRYQPDAFMSWNHTVPIGSSVRLAQGSIESLPSVALGRGIAPGNTLDWEKELQKQREVSFEHTLKLIQKRLLTRARSDELARLKALDPLRVEISDQAYQKARLIFEQYAEPIGILRVKLANRVGVPTPSSNQPKVRRPWYPATPAEVVELKKRISVLEAAYHRDLGAVIDQASAESDRLIASARMTTAVREDEALLEAKRIVDRLRAESSDPRTAAPVVGSQTRVAGVPGVRAGSAGQTGTTRAATFTATANLNPDARSALRQDALLWAKRNGWKLVDSSRATDRTEEFWKWREQFLAGPLRK